MTEAQFTLKPEYQVETEVLHPGTQPGEPSYYVKELPGDEFMKVYPLSREGITHVMNLLDKTLGVKND